MTLNAAYRCGGIPILISDFLVTNQGAGDHIVIPSIEDISKVLPDQYQKSFSLVRKTKLILPNFVITGSGDGDAIEAVFRRLSTFCWPEFGIADLQSYLDTQTGIGACTIVGHLVDLAGTHTFRWQSSTNTFETGDRFIEGRGRTLFLDVLPTIDLGPIAPGFELEVCTEAAVNAVATLMANELKQSNTLLSGFGGGYDIYIFAKGEFKLLDEIVYLFYQIWLQSADTIRCSQLPVYWKISYLNQTALLLSFITHNGIVNLAVPPQQRIALVHPVILADRTPIPNILIKELDLRGKIYGIGLIGKHKSGADEVFTAVVQGAGAQDFNIKLTGKTKDGLDEVRFECPDVIMNNISAAAFVKFTRDI